MFGWFRRPKSRVVYDLQGKVTTNVHPRTGYSYESKNHYLVQRYVEDNEGGYWFDVSWHWTSGDAEGKAKAIAKYPLTFDEKGQIN